MFEPNILASTRYTAKGQTVFAGSYVFVDLSDSRVYTLDGQELFPYFIPNAFPHKHGLEECGGVEEPEKSTVFKGDAFTFDSRTTTGYKENLKQAVY